MELGDIKKVQCNTCQVWTNHEVKGIQGRISGYENYLENEEAALVTSGKQMLEAVSSGLYDKDMPLRKTQYRFLVCQGCETASLEIASAESESFLADGEIDWKILGIFPERQKSTKIQAKHYKDLGPVVNLAYDEVIHCYNQGMHVLPPMGLRAVLEAILVDRVITDKVARPLTGKINKAVEEGLIAPDLAAGFFGLKFLGDEAVHKLREAETEEIVKGVELIDKLIKSWYQSYMDLRDSARSMSQLKKERERKARNLEAGED